MNVIDKHFSKKRWHAVLSMAWPLVIANSFWNLQVTIDRIFLGQHSTDELGAAQAVMGVFWTPMALLQQTAAYTITFAAQYIGSDQKEKIGPAIWQSIYISIVGGLLLLGLVPFSETLFGAFGHSENITLLETQYFRALMFSALPTALVAGISGFYTGINKTKMVMWINGVGLASNVVLDYLLVFGNLGFPEMGIIGAGYATAGANFMAAGFAACLIFTKENEQIYHVRSGYLWDLALMKRFLRFGLPSGLQWALEGLAFTVFLIIVGRMENGDAALAASSIAVTALLLAVLPPMGIAQAVSAKVGQYLGADDPDNAAEFVWTGVQISSLFIFLVALSLVLAPNFYASWFQSDQDPAKWATVLPLIAPLLAFAAFFACCDAINVQLSFALKGAGDTRFVSLVVLVLPWPVFVVPTYLTHHWDAAIYWAWGFAAIYSVLLAGIFYLRFQGGKWRSMRVFETPQV